MKLVFPLFNTEDEEKVKTKTAKKAKKTSATTETFERAGVERSLPKSVAL